MELVMLENVDKKTLLANANEKKRQEYQKKDISCKIEIYDPKPQGIVDSVVSKKIAELRETETKKIKTKNTEREKLMNAAVFTDIPATIKKAGFHLDGSPKLAIAGLFDEKVDFVIDNNQAKYRSSSLSIVLADVKIDWKELILFFLGLAGAIASVVMSVIAGQVVKDYFGYGYEHKTLFFIGILIPIITVFVKVVVISNTDGYFTRLSGIRKTRKTRLNFSVSTAVPKVPESVLSQIIGPGPFAILFEVTEGWRKIQPDPVIFRVITIDDQQFFEPVVGYDMTPLEKASLVEA